MENKKPFFKVDYSKTEQPAEQIELQKICNHSQVEVLDISLEDGNHPNRKSTVISGICEICGFDQTLEI